MDLSFIQLEPVVFCVSLSHSILRIVEDELLLDKACKVDLAYSEEDCANLTQHKDADDRVQDYVLNIKIASSFMKAIPSIIVTLLAGIYMDHNRKKLALIVPQLGFMIGHLSYLLNWSFYHDLSAWWLLAHNLYSLAGGMTPFYTVTYAYMAGVTGTAFRTNRFFTISGVSLVGGMLGKFFSGYIKEEWGQFWLFGFGILILLLSSIYTLWRVPNSPSDTGDRDSDPKQNESDTQQSDSRPCCSMQFLKSGYDTVVAKRPHPLKILVVSLAALMGLERFINTGKYSLLYLYLKKVLKNHSFMDYTNLRAGMDCAAILSKFVLMQGLARYCEDPTILFIAIFGCLLQSLVLTFLMGFPCMIYAVVFFGTLSGSIYEIIKSCLTKIVNLNEVGKVHSSADCLTEIVGLLSSVFFNLFYQKTLSDVPEISFGIISILYLGYIAAIGFVMYYWKKRDPVIEEKQEELEEEGNNDPLMKEEDGELKPLDKTDNSNYSHRFPTNNETTEV